MIAATDTALIGSVILLALVGVTVWQSIVRSGAYPWYGRVALTVAATFLVAGFTGVALDVVGLGVDDEADASDELRDELSTAGYTPDEIDCVEATVIREYGSVEAISDAEDVTAGFVAMMACKDDIGMDVPMITCWVGELVDHFDMNRFDADAMSDMSDALSEPEHRRFATVTSLTCQGLPEDAAACIYETVTAVHPEMIGDGTPGLTAQQQGWLLDAGRECGVPHQPVRYRPSASPSGPELSH